jgi:threonylcarbamoyladenosine tRNA methylthiotransferase MtaB
VDLVLGTEDKLRVLDYIAQGKPSKPLVITREIEPEDFRIELCAGEMTRPLTHRANLKIQDGCDQCCSFCVVPLARGPARSRDFDNLVDDARGLVQRGAKEIVVTGVNVGAYRHGRWRVLDVIDRLNEIPGLRRIRIGSIELNAISEPFFDRMNDPHHGLVPFLHVPLQSGSNRVLARMCRPCTAEAFMDFAKNAVSAVPDLCIGTDILVGMPGETEADFEETCRVLSNGPIAYAHVFKYSARKGTPAETMDGKVDAATLNSRSERVRAIAAERRRRYHGRFLGRVCDVLFEEKEKDHWFGYTGNYIRVATCCQESLENEIRPVLLEQDCGEHMLGRLAP